MLWQPPKFSREQWILGMRERNPKWAPQTAVDLADCTERLYAARGLKVEDWSHVWIIFDLRVARDERYDHLLVPDHAPEYFLAGSPAAKAAPSPPPPTTDPHLETRPKRRRR